MLQVVENIIFRGTVDYEQLNTRKYRHNLLRSHQLQNDSGHAKASV